MRDVAIEIGAAVAGRALLDAQALLDPPGRRATVSSVQKLIERIGFVQIDSINVVERAHHLTLFSRLSGYRPAMLTELLERRRSLFEHWTHDASAIPTQWFPHWRPRFVRYRDRSQRNAWWVARLGDDAERLIAEIREHVERHGPVQSRDFERDAGALPPPEKGWWGWSPQKAALEHLWRSGELAIVKRVNFQKHYDLAARVFPDAHALPEPSAEEHVEWACSSALARLGIANPTELAAFWRSIDIAHARKWCARGLASGELLAVEIAAPAGGKPYRGVASASSARALQRAQREHLRSIGPRTLTAAIDDASAIRLLSPFDPVVRDRARALRLFDFDYRFEAFVPAAARKHGYYVMPLLQDGRLVGRTDPKFHRDRGELVLAGTHWEPGVRPTRPRRAALEAAAGELAAFIGAERVRIEK